MIKNTITPQELKSLSPETILLDVRTTGEYQAKHLSQAVNVPLDQLNQSKLREYQITQSIPVVLICQSGKRAEKACQILQQLNYDNLKILQGGINACGTCNNLTFIEGQGVISLERQVRIAAGSFVLIGIILSYLIDPSFYLLSAFVGAGLIFSGITDTCGLAMVLAKMPWNQK